MQYICNPATNVAWENLRLDYNALLSDGMTYLVMQLEHQILEAGGTIPWQSKPLEIGESRWTTIGDL